MGLLDAFNETWSQARETFGQGTPEDGSKFDGSSRLLQMKSSVEAAAPDSRWQGTASDAYAAANKEHAQVYGKLADLDRRMATEVTNAANVVTTGRQNLDNVKSWVTSMAASIPDTDADERDRKLLPIVNKGVSQLSDIIQKSTNDMTDIRGRVQGIKGEYDALTNQKFAPGEKGPGEKTDDKRLGVKGDGEGSTNPEEKSPAETGAADSRALQNGQLTPEQRERLSANTTLDPAQRDALNKGTLQLPPEQMAYLQGFSRAFGDKTPAEIKAIMEKANQANAGDGSRVADAFQLASNTHIKTGEPGTNPPSIDHPASGGKYALPEGIQKVLDGPVLTPLTVGDTKIGPNGSIQPPDIVGASQPVNGLNDLADIIQSGDRGLQKGTDLDSGLFKQSQRLLEMSNGWPVPGMDPESDRPRWYHQMVDPTLQNMFNAVNKDDIVIHDSIVGPPETHQPDGNQTFLTPEGRKFLDNLTAHQWQDDGLAAGGLFDWVGETANHDIDDRAANTAHSLAEYVSDGHDRLLNLPGTDNLPLGKVNPELTRDWARDFAPYYDDMVGQHDGDNNGVFSPLDPDGTPSPEKTRHLMSVLLSDQPPPDKHPGDAGPKTASEIVFDSTKFHVENALDKAATSIPDPNQGDNKQAAVHAGRLQAALDLGSYDEANDRMKNDFDAKHAAWKLRSQLFDLGKDLGSTIPNGGGQIVPVLALGKEFFIGTEPVQGYPPSVDLPDTYQIQKHMAEALIRAHYGDPSIFGDALQDGHLIPPPQSGDDKFNDFRQHLTDYLDDIDPTHGFDTLAGDYWRVYTTAVAHGYQQK
ncbi:MULTISPECIES: TPR repeat region-containing protein [unclassified Mycolicibacterium]|uniref:TPR repeat region-containing protein n=1 Tax=unclassified Mycolicibacterium TaxID=2636767 RepID=UPI002ED96DA8